jgi:cell division protease FtsH
MVLKKNIDILHRLAEALLEKETVLGNELDRLILELRPGFDFPSKHEHAATQEPEPEAGRKTEENKTSEAPEAEETSEASDEDASDDPERDNG